MSSSSDLVGVAAVVEVDVEVEDVEVDDVEVEGVGGAPPTPFPYLTDPRLVCGLQTIAALQRSDAL